MSATIPIPQQGRSALICTLTILAVTPILCLVAAGWCIWRALYPLWCARPIRWLRAEANITARELWQDRHELAAYLFALAVLAFLIFLYPFHS